MRRTATVAVTLAFVMLGACGKLFGIDHIPYAGDAGPGGPGDAPSDAALVAKLELGSASYDFGSIGQGQATFALSIQLNNTGTATSGVITIAKAGDADDFAINPTTDGCSNRSLDANASCAFKVAFTPTMAGMRTAMVSAGDQVVSATSTFTGIGLVPGALTMSPSPIDFGMTSVSGSSPAQTVTLKNTGQTNLQIVQLMFNDPMTFNTVAGSSCLPLPHPLGPNGTCTVEVNFTPQIGGSHVTSLTAHTDAVMNPDTSASLGGIGTGAIAISLAGAGTGRVSTAAGEIDCSRNGTLTGPTCMATFATATVMLSADTMAPNAFQGFSANCLNGTAGSTTCLLDITAPIQTVTATFSRYPTLTVMVTGSSGKVVAPTQGIDCATPASQGTMCTMSYPPGTQVNLTTQTLDPNGLFSVWTGACANQNANDSPLGPGACSVVMTGDQMVGADFENTFTINLVPDPQFTGVGAMAFVQLSMPDLFNHTTCQSGQICSFHYALAPPAGLTINAFSDGCAVFNIPTGWRGSGTSGGCTNQGNPCNWSSAGALIDTIDYQYNRSGASGCP